MDNNSFFQKVKRALGVTTLLITVFSGSAQDSIPASKQKLRPGLAVSGSYMNNGGFNFYHAQFALTLQKPKHVFSLGVIVGFNDNDLGITEKHDIERAGAGGEFCYQYYPNSSKKTFNLYVFGNASFLSYNYSSTQYYGYGSYTTQINHYKTLKAAGGFGMRVNLARWVYLYEHNGVGLNYLSATTENVNSYFPMHSNYNDKDLVGLLQASLGFGFVF
jgi:hypothetical protein